VPRNKLTTKERAARKAARWQIVQAANRHKIRVRYQPVLFDLRHVQQAVRLARHHGLVKPKVLEAAGYRSAPR